MSPPPSIYPSTNTSTNAAAAAAAASSTSNSPSWWRESSGVRKQLPSSLTIRPLQAEDYDRDRFEYMHLHEETYRPVVIIDETQQKIVACGTLLIERKFIHQCALLAHIEDIVVCQSQRGKGLGRLIVQQLKELAFKAGCYKITLDCDVSNEPFYGKVDFERKGLQMCIYYRDDPAITPTSPKYPLYQQQQS